MQKRAPSHPEQNAEEEKRKRPSEPPGHECRGEGDEEFGQDDKVFQWYDRATKPLLARLTFACLPFLHRRRLKSPMDRLGAKLMISERRSIIIA